MSLQSTFSFSDDKASIVHEEGVQPSLVAHPNDFYKPKVANGDEAAQVLAEVTERGVVTPEEDRHILRMIDRGGNDRVLTIERVRDNNMGVEAKIWRWEQFWETFHDPKTYLWFALLFLAACPSGGISALGSLIIQGFGFNSFQSILFNMRFGVLSIVSIFGGAWLTNKIKLRFLVIILMCCFPIAGATAMRAPLNACGHTKKVTTTAVFFVAQCIVGPQVYKTEMKPRYTPGLVTDLACWCVLAVLLGFTALYLHFLNRRQAAKRVRKGKASVVVDTSILIIEEAALARGVNEKNGEMNDQAFDDLTDFHNEDFVYVL